MRRRGITLIELIFSIVILSIVFSIIPKIIFASNKSMQTSIKEDALFNAYTLLGSIVKLPWDENTTRTGNILWVSEGNCSDFRKGLFIGSRECQLASDGNNSASAIVGQSGDKNDIGDYDNFNESYINSSKYKLDVNVSYVNDDYSQNPLTTNLKEINVTVESNTPKTEGFKSSFFYYSANLGLIQIKKEVWK